MSERILVEGWSGPWDSDDPDANLKSDIALYSHVDALATVRGLSESTDVPVGAIVHYVLARWASEGSAGLLELGPTMVRRLEAVCDTAEESGTDEARLEAFEILRQMIAWLHHPLEHPDIYDS